MHDFGEAVRNGPAEIERKAIEILNTVLLVMITMEIVYTVAISLESLSDTLAKTGAHAGMRPRVSKVTSCAAMTPAAIRNGRPCLGACR